METVSWFACHGMPWPTRCFCRRQVSSRILKLAGKGHIIIVDEEEVLWTHAAKKLCHVVGEQERGLAEFLVKNMTETSRKHHFHSSACAHVSHSKRCTQDWLGIRISQNISCITCLGCGGALNLGCASSHIRTGTRLQC